MRPSWIAACVAALLGLAAAGGAVATAAQQDGPAAVAQRFFHAVADADAPLALGLAAQPAPSPYLTSTVLREQRAVARLTDVRVVSVTATGTGRRTAAVRYRLDFADGPVEVSDQVQLVSHAGSWRLVDVSSAVALTVQAAPGRISLAGRPLPATARLFPGAVPVSSDWAGISVTNHPAVRLAAQDVSVQVDAAVNGSGRAELGAAIDAGLRRCLQAGSDDLNCPTPTVAPDRPVPGTLHGQLLGAPDPSVVIGDAGLLTATATVSVRGSAQVWDYNNIAASRAGDFTVAVTAHASVANPRAVVFSR